MKNRLNNKSSEQKRIANIKTRIDRFCELVKELVSSQGLDRVTDEYINPINEEAHDLFASVLGIPVAAFQEDQTFSHLVMDYLKLISNSKTLPIIKALDQGMLPEGITKEGSFKYVGSGYLIINYYLNLQSFTEEQRQEFVSLFNKYFPTIQAGNEYSTVFMFQIIPFFKEVIYDMLINQAFQDLLESRRLSRKFAHLWDADFRAELNVTRLFSTSVPRDRIFSSSISIEEREAKTIREKIKDGSDLHVYSCLMDMKNSSGLNNITIEKIKFALQQLNHMQGLYARKIADRDAASDKAIYNLAPEPKLVASIRAR